VGIVVAAFGAAAGGCGGSSPPQLASGTGSATSSAKTAAPLPIVPAGRFTDDYSAMASLRAVAGAGRGKIAAILPGATGSSGQAQADRAAAIRRSLLAAGLPAAAVVVQTASDDASQLRDAQRDVAGGAKVLIVDPVSAGAGAQIDGYARSRGVQVIEDGHMTPGGGAPYFVGFGAAQAGATIGEGLVSCASAWGVGKPQVIVMRPRAADKRSTLLYQGYTSALAPYFRSGRFADVANTAGSSDAATALTQFEVAYTGHPGASSALVPSDDAAAPIIAYLQSRGVKPRTFPITGRGATLTGLQNVLAGYQCGTAYEPIYLEAQAAAELALYLRAGKPPPAALVNATSADPATHAKVASVLLAPKWVTAANMNDTIVRGDVVATGALCAGEHAADCRAAGISVRSQSDFAR